MHLNKKKVPGMASKLRRQKFIMNYQIEHINDFAKKKYTA
jgi:hypothetical protein